MKDRIVLLNTSILTTYGEFVYTPLTLDDVIHNINSFKEQGLEILSAIGHESTAQVLSDLLGMKIEVNRVYYTQEVTDNCIIFKLNGRPREGVILTREDIENIGYSFGLLIKKEGGTNDNS